MDDATKQYWDDYYSHPRFNKTTDTGVSPQQQQQQTKQEMTKTTPAEPGSYFGDPNSPWYDQVARGVGMGVDQMAIGAAGLPMTALNLGWRGLHALQPDEVGEAPAWTYSSGPGSYADVMTPNALAPRTQLERDYAAGARTAGAILPFAFTGLGPVAAGTAIGTSVGGEELTAHGHPYLGAVLEAGGGLVAGRSYSPRLPNPLQTWHNAPPTATQSARAAQQTAQQSATMAQAQQHHDQLMDLLRRSQAMDALSPITHSHNWMGAMINAGIMGVSGATQAARRILGYVAGDPVGNLVGAGLGTVSASEAPSPINMPDINYTAPGQPAQPPGVTWTPPQ